MTGPTLVAVTALILVGSHPLFPAAQTKGTIKIAVQGPLSGPLAGIGEGVKLGAQLAIEQLKAPIEQMGYKVALVPLDDQATPSVGVANARNISSDNDVLVVVGHLNSGVSIPASEVYKEAGLAMISPASTNPLLTDRGYPNVFRVCGRDDVQGVVGAEFAKSLDIKSVYVLHDTTAYGEGLAEIFAPTALRNGITLLGLEGTAEKSNFEPIITTIKARSPDLIYFAGLYDQAGPFFRQARERGVRSRFMGPDGMDSPELVKIAGKAVVGMHYSTLAAPVSAYPQGRRFVDEYQKRFGRSPEPSSVGGHDAAAVALKAIAIAVSRGDRLSREKVAAALRDVKYEGLTGVIEFDQKGDRRASPYFVVQVASVRPEKWSENKLIRQLTVAAPSATKRP
jgi:branched-chain amino acid transport system substrate-binding protein